jgi:hypothetical protein
MRDERRARYLGARRSGIPDCCVCSEAFRLTRFNARIVHA